MTTIVSSGRPRSAKSHPLSTGQVTRMTATPHLVQLLRGDNPTVSYEWIFRSQPILHSVVMKLVYGFCKTPLKAYIHGEDDDRERDRTSALAQLLRRPAPGISPFELKARCGLDLFVHGHALQLKVRERGPGSPPKELWPVPWRNVIPLRDEVDEILGYQITIGGRVIERAPSEVVHYPLPGGSPIESLRSTLALEDAGQTYMANSIANGINPRTAFTSEQRIPDTVLARLQKEIEQFYGGVDNAGVAMILDMGLEPKKIGTSPVDMDLLNQRKLNREEVCAAYDVDPVAMGLEQAAFAGKKGAKAGVYDGIDAKLALVEEAMQAQLVDPEPAWDGAFAEFDRNEWLRPDPVERARMHMLNQQSSTTTINDRRADENKPRIDHPLADAVLVPTNMRPVGGPELEAWLAEHTLDPNAGPVADPNAGTPEQGATDANFLTASRVRLLLEALGVTETGD